PAYFKGDDLPVERVSWDDVQEFCRKLEALTGRKFRLPTEAEWEYAARAGTTTPFAFGASLSSEQANFNGNYPYGGAQKGVYREKTTTVGRFNPNQFGLYDMHGNVWEWVEDIWHGNYEGAPTDGSAWVSGSNSSRRVLRGGSWGVNGVFCRSAVRGHITPDTRYDKVGFRVVVGERAP
ncbi:MAG: formylglycine-generating enzyme family protein, partial [Acidobacteriota bacterium]